MASGTSYPINIESVLNRVAKSGCTIKSQQRNEPELTESEKVTILREIILQRPATFLMRFGKRMAEEDLACFDHLRDDYEVNFRLTELKTFFDSRKSKVSVRNRRYECLRRLISKSDYFSEESMRKRNPFLYEQYVGQYLTAEEKLQRDNTAMGEDPSLSDFLLFRQERDMTEWLYEYQKEQEEQVIEEEEDSLSESESNGDKEGGDTAIQAEDEKQRLREEFSSIMQDNFIRGEDMEFDYQEVDTNADYDDLKLVERDEEEKYFDDDEPDMSDHGT